MCYNFFMEKKKLRFYFWSIFLSSSLLFLIIVFSLPREQKYIKRWDLIKEAEAHPYTQLLKEYVQIDTSQPEGNTLSSAVFLAMLLEKEGIRTEIYESAPQKANLIAKIGGGKKPPIILHHHMDTEEVINEEGWKYDPWDGVIHNGFLYGIGSLDMKSMGLCFLYAFIKAHQEKWNLERPIIYYASCAEELDFKAGSLWMLENYPEYFPEGSLFLTEGGIVEMITDSVRFAGIEIGQKGFAWFGLNITKEQKDLLEKETEKIFKDKPILNPHVVKFFKDISEYRVAFFKDCLKDIENCIKGLKKEEIQLPQYLKSLLYSEGTWIEKRRNSTSPIFKIIALF